MTQKNKILLLSGNQLSNNPRVIKEADALAQAGYQVTVLGGNFTADGKLRDQKIMIDRPWAFQYGFDLTANTSVVLWTKFQRIAGSVLYKYFGRQNCWQMGYGSDALMKKVVCLKPQLVIAHSEVALGVCGRLLPKGVPVGIDMEDWFSEDLLPEARRRQPIRLLKSLEKNLLCRGTYSSCTSERMADALVKAYMCRRPLVIRNVFPIKDREEIDGKWKDRSWMVRWMMKNDPTIERPKEAPVSIHWFSQTIGPGRGLEQLLKALDGLQGNWELHLRGNIQGYEKWLQEACPVQVYGKLKIHPQVCNKELLSRIAEHDIGYCGEPAEPPNKNLTISNKFFQYLQAGLAVLASDTAGQNEGASQAKGAVWIFPGGNKIGLAKKLEALLRDPSALQKMRQSAWQAGEKLTWENESQRLLAALP